MLTTSQEIHLLIVLIVIAPSISFHNFSFACFQLVPSLMRTVVKAVQLLVRTAFDMFSILALLSCSKYLPTYTYLLT